MNVSIVIPAWNAEATLAETLESVLAQTHADWEAVVVVDGSTDGTGDLAGEYSARDHRIRLVPRENGGEAAARNTGIEWASHPWLLFLDADDWIAPDHLARMTAALRADPTLDAVHCDHVRVAGDGTCVPNDFVPPEGDMFAVWARRSAFPVHAAIVRADLVRDVGGFDTSLRKSADWDLWQRVARTGARFGAVREVLAFYRMHPAGASLDAEAMFRAGMTVLSRGHAADPRVGRPHPDHAVGAPPDGVRSQAWYLLSWCAGLLLGRGEDARPLLGCIPLEAMPDLYAPGIARSIWDSALLPLCEPPRAWPGVWERVHPRVTEFLEALEEASGTPALAANARSALVRWVLGLSPGLEAVLPELEAADGWQAVARRAEERAAALAEEAQALRDERGRLSVEAGTLRAEADARAAEVRAMREKGERAAERVRALEDALAEGAERERALADEVAALGARVERIETTLAGRDARIADLEKSEAALREARDRAASERNAVWNSPERRAGDFVLNRLRLAGPTRLGQAVWTRLGRRLGLWGLAAERAMRPGARRAVTTVCWNFPIHSQTFVYQELTHLARHDFRLRLVYSKLEPRDQLPERYGHLWGARRRLFLDRTAHERDFRHYQRRMGSRVDALVDRLAEAAGMDRAVLLDHGNVLESFTFTRMVEAYGAHYLHSYFFYDRSLMALVASQLLGVPRGVSCYADHRLKDYELKVVPLHMELCDVVIATSRRIRDELLEIAPDTDPAKILVKANGIDPASFPATEHPEPAAGQPHRIVCVCRIEPKKGLIELVEAVHLLKERGVRVEAHVVGAPDEWSAASVEYAGRLHRRIVELGLVGTVHTEGRHGHEGVLRFHRISHLFVAPFVETDTGDKDGIPTALLEGMSSGLPAVASDAGSITEVVTHGSDGWVVPARSPEALADAIEALLADPALRREMGQNAAATVRERFDAHEGERAFHARVDALLDARGRR